jgi:hypothetical protein
MITHGEGCNTIFSKGMSGGQRFDMAFETILGLTLVKSDVLIPWQNRAIVVIGTGCRTCINTGCPF